MSTPLVLLGAGGFARETVELVRAVNDPCPTFELLGFLDDDPKLHGTTRNGTEILGPLAALAEMPDVAVAVCLGSPENPTLRRSIVARLALPDERFATLVHPSSTIGASVHVGVGTVVHAGCVMTAELSIGRHVSLMPNVIVTHDDVLEDFVTVGGGTTFAGSVSVGESAYVGAGVAVREGVDIGRDSLVGLGSVVLSDVPVGEVWAGVPARHIRMSTSSCTTTRHADAGPRREEQA